MIKVYGFKEKIDLIRQDLCFLINKCLTDVFQLPKEKIAHRYIGLKKENFIIPEGRSFAYTIIEIYIMEGRSPKSKKKLIDLLFQTIESGLGISPIDIEITIIESPPCNWGFRGINGEDAKLDYNLNI